MYILSLADRDHSTTDISCDRYISHGASYRSHSIHVVIVLAILEIGAKKMSDISRTNQPFLATSTVWQPQTHSCNAICQDWWTDSLHSKTHLETAFVYLLFHSFQKPLERVGWRRRRGAYRLTNRLQTFANTVKDIFEPDGFVVIDFLVRHRRLPSILFSVMQERVSVVNAVVRVEEMVVRNGRLRRIATNVNTTLALRFSLNETFDTLY